MSGTIQVVPSDTLIPAYPMLHGESATTDLSSSAGAVGILRNGVSLFRSVPPQRLPNLNTASWEGRSATLA